MIQRKLKDCAFVIFMHSTWRCFPECSFLDAGLRSNLSNVWRSLLKAREVILAGAKWKVGSGTTIEIMGHQWLLRPLCLRREGPGPLKVRE